jgi:tRNA threonylcarbamoyladenosine biosynthesis protein TsaB
VIDAGAVRVLGIEMSSRRGTVALVESGVAVATRGHAASHAHGDHALGLVEETLALAGWAKTSLDRIAVGVGPGSFTGVRVGLALAQGIGLGLRRPVLGVGSLRAMCHGAPPDVAALRCAVLDARRGELFAAVHDSRGLEVAPPRTVAPGELRAWLATIGTGCTLFGEAAATEEGLPVYRSDLTDLPHAVCVALLAGELTPLEAPAEPLYVRAPDAIRPNLPRSPLSSGEPT